MLRVVDMAVTISPGLLRYVSAEIVRGRPLAALLRAAEYLESDEPLWKALVASAHNELAEIRYRDADPAIRKLLNGELDALSAAELRLVKEVREPDRAFRRRSCPSLLMRRTVTGFRRASGLRKFKLAP